MATLRHFIWETEVMPSERATIAKINEIIDELNLINPDDITSLKARVTALETSVSQLQNAVGALQGSVTLLTGKVAILEADSAALKTDSENVKITLYTPLENDLER